MKFNRIFLIVLDSLGVGEASDADKFNDLGASTLGHILEYNPIDYPKFDTYDAINVSKTSDIPCDYNGVMGVPITFLDKYSPDQFSIIGLDRYVEDNPYYGHRFTINGKETYARILIKKK